MKKIFIDVLVKFSQEGEMIPLKLRWWDNRVYLVNQILCKEPRASLKCGGQGLRYTCKIEGKIVYLFFEEGKWFIEGVGDE